MPEEHPGGRPVPGPDDAPPLLGSWPRLYALVLGFLALLVALFHAFTQRFK